MPLEQVQAYFEQAGLGDRVKVLDQSSATVELAAQALGCQPREIAKTMSFYLEDGPVLIITAGDAKIDNRKYKDFFHQKARMIPWEEVGGGGGPRPRRGVPLCPEARGAGVSGCVPPAVCQGVPRRGQRQQRGGAHPGGVGGARGELRLGGPVQRLAGGAPGLKEKKENRCGVCRTGFSRFSVSPAGRRRWRRRGRSCRRAGARPLRRTR